MSFCVIGGSAQTHSVAHTQTHNRPLSVTVGGGGCRNVALLREALSGKTQQVTAGPLFWPRPLALLICAVLTLSEFNVYSVYKYCMCLFLTTFFFT